YRRQLFLPLGLRAALEAEVARCDLAHIHGHHHLLGVLGSRCLRRAGVPYVVGPNGLAPCSEGQRLAKPVFDALLGRDVLPGAARVLAVSAAERADLARLGVCPGALRVVPNPVDVTELDVRPRGDGLRSLLGEGVERAVLYL